MVKPPFFDKMNIKGGHWASEEEEEEVARVLAYESKHGARNETRAPRKAESSSTMKGCVKNCKSKWSNYQKFKLSHESFTQQEDELIIKLHAVVGNRWGIIAHQLPGRTDNDIKNHWNTKLKKKLTNMGIDPITHKPFSQILEDYGNIGGLSRATSGSKHMGTMKRDLKKVTSFTPPKEPLLPSLYTFSSNSQVSNYPSPLQNNYFNHDYSNNSHSPDLLSQLQALSYVSEGSHSISNLHPTELFQVAFSDSSSILASTCSYKYNAPQMVKSTDSFSWHDYLLDEASKPSQSQAQEQLLDDIGCGFSSTQPHMLEAGDAENNRHQFQASSSSSTSSDASSFLEAMLDQENDTFLTFPGLMEEPLY